MSAEQLSLDAHLDERTRGCVYCRAGPDEFRYWPKMSTVGCSRCEAVVPVRVEWYRRGERLG